MAFTVAELADLQAAQEDAMTDTVIPLIRSAAPDSYGQMVETFVVGTAIIAGFRMRAGREVQIGDQTVILDGTVRLERSVYGTLSQGDRLRLTHRNGVALTTAEDWELIGLPAIGPSGLVWDVKRVVL